MATWLKMGIASFFAIVLSTYSVAAHSKSPVSQPFPDHHIIAHALGGIDGNTYTNSKEAIELSYKNGFRFMEADFQLTSDGVLVAKHDWNTYKTPPTYQQFMSTKIDGKYTPLSFKDVAEFMNEHPDVYLDTDTKNLDSATIQKEFMAIVNTAKEINPNILNRIIPEIYTPQMYYLVNDIYHFPNQFYSIYMIKENDSAIINFMNENHLNNIAMDTAQINPTFIHELKQNNKNVYVFTVDDMNKIKQLKQMGVDGFYTDFLPSSLDK